MMRLFYLRFVVLLTVGDGFSHQVIDAGCRSEGFWTVNTSFNSAILQSPSKGPSWDWEKVEKGP